MKVLSLLQPYASLCVTTEGSTALKTKETRSWNTSFKGDLLIHSSLGKKYKKIPYDNLFWKHYHLKFAHNKIAPIDDLPFGCIIGQVTMTGVERMEAGIEDFMLNSNCDNEQEFAFGEWSEGRFAWTFENPILFKDPIPCKGQLSIWNLPTHLEPLVIEQLKLCTK